MVITQIKSLNTGNSKHLILFRALWNLSAKWHSQSGPRSPKSGRIGYSIYQADSKGFHNFFLGFDLSVKNVETHSPHINNLYFRVIAS